MASRFENSKKTAKISLGFEKKEGVLINLNEVREAREKQKEIAGRRERILQLSQKAAEKVSW